jgi:hypothetical protein
VLRLDAAKGARGRMEAHRGQEGTGARANGVRSEHVGRRPYDERRRPADGRDAARVAGGSGAEQEVDAPHEDRRLCQVRAGRQGDRRFSDADHTVDRAGTDGILSELDEYAVEEALKLAEADGGQHRHRLTVGPDGATDALRKALQMGATDAVHVLDDALHGTDALGTSLVLAKALAKLGPDLVLTGMASTDGGMSVVPAMVAERPRPAPGDLRPGR